jgi:hypothetical protein
MNTKVITHCTYLALGLSATIAVVWTLRRRGLPFLVQWCDGVELLAASW